MYVNEALSVPVRSPLFRVIFSTRARVHMRMYMYMYMWREY